MKSRSDEIRLWRVKTVILSLGEESSKILVSSGSFALLKDDTEKKLKVENGELKI